MQSSRICPPAYYPLVQRVENNKGQVQAPGTRGAWHAACVQRAAPRFVWNNKSFFRVRAMAHRKKSTARMIINKSAPPPMYMV